MQFESHDQISALFHWGAINSQVRLKAKINKTSAKFSDNHFQSRTKEKNALAISSNQSKQIDSFDFVKDNMALSGEFPVPLKNKIAGHTQGWRLCNHRKGIIQFLYIVISLSPPPAIFRIPCYRF